MAVVTRERGTFTHPSAAGRRRTRYAAAALSAVIGVLYLVVLFVMFGAGAPFGPGHGVFDYDALSDLPMELWAAVVTGGEVVLLGLLLYLAAAVPVRHTAAG